MESTDGNGQATAAPAQVSSTFQKRPAYRYIRQPDKLPMERRPS
jgi:hypothetical protein